MLSTIKASDCSYVRFSSDEITQHDDSYQLELVVTNENDGTSFTVPINASDVITSECEDPYFQYVLSNGIYGISLVKTIGFQKTFKNACLFLDCDIRCNAVTKDIETSMLHYSLNLAEQCDCDCSKMQPIYELLLQKLEDNPCSTC